MPKNKDAKTLRFLLNPVTIVTAVILLIGLALTGIVILFLGKGSMPTAEATPVVMKIAAPSLTPKPTDPIALPTSTPTVFFLPEGVIGVGAYVQVIGTEGAGLRMRSEPGLAGEVHFTALDSEVFLVIEGPVEVDGYTWWHLEAPYDKSRSGWSAGNFLTPIEGESD